MSEEEQKIAADALRQAFQRTMNKLRRAHLSGAFNEYDLLTMPEIVNDMQTLHVGLFGEPFQIVQGKPEEKSE
jgi:hypothetical protein